MTPVLSELTPRQTQIVELVVQGYSNKEVARILAISDGTVKQHLHAVYERLNVTSRGKLAHAISRLRETLIDNAEPCKR